MDEDGLPIVGAAVDLTKVSPIDFKRTLAFLNHFTCNTMNFLNKFAAVCETKLEDVSIRIQRLETSLCILESKLASIPGLEEISLISTSNSNGTEATAADTSPAPTSFVSQNETPSPVDNSNNKNTSEEKEESPVAANGDVDTSKENIALDERYAKYLKMIRMGVPAMALRPKMIADGLNPDLIINGKADASGPVNPNVNTSGSEGSQSDSSSCNSDGEFSD
ncbi:coiled-coil domain containing 53 [Chamberlinius hualienensis]